MSFSSIQHIIYIASLLLLDEKEKGDNIGGFSESVSTFRHPYSWRLSLHLIKEKF